MKSYILAVAALTLLFSPTLGAQARFSAGVIAGASSSHLSGDIPENGSYTSKTGFSIGLVAESELWKDIRLSIQPSFVRRGTGLAYDVGEEELRDSAELTLDYFSIPLVARFLTPGGSWFVNGGLDLGFLLGADLKNVVTGSKSDVQSYINNVDLMMLLGVGKNFQLEPVVLSFELRYGQSLLNAGANEQLTKLVGISPRFRSSGFQLLVALVYPL
jgi:hypothetical protein